MATDIDILENLSKPLPEEAIQEFTFNGKVMRGYKTQYIIDRLNTVFGFAWDFDIERNIETGEPIIKVKDDFVGAYCVLTIYNFDDNGNKVIAKQVRQWGESSVNEDSYHDEKVFGWPSAFKAAMSDGLCKCASWIGVGGDAYKGKLANQSKPELTQKDLLINQIKKAAKLKNLKDKDLQKMCKEALGKIEKIVLTELSEEELTTLVETLGKEE